MADAPVGSDELVGRAIVYVDGLNLYGSALRGTDLKWLDVYRMALALTPADHELSAVKYFSAELSPVAAEDPDSPKRQRNYMKALAAMDVDVRRGTFVVGTEWRTLVQKVPWADRTRPRIDESIAERLDADEASTDRPWKAYVQLPEEKFTDVALGVELVDDFHNRQCELAILITNDSDLQPAIKKVVDQGHTVGLFSPSGDTNKHLRKVASWVRPIRPSVYASNQFPDIIRTATGSQFERPRAWKRGK